MSQFEKKFTEIETFINNERKPDFKNLLKVLKREKPDRPTLFEFFMNENIYKSLTCKITYNEADVDSGLMRAIDAFKLAGYDYFTLHGSDFHFHSNRHQEKDEKSISLNSGAIIFDRKSFEEYKWPDPETFDYSRLERVAKYLPEGMEFIVFGPGGVLENVIELVGYENLCYMTIDDPELAYDIFEAVGSRLVKYYDICSKYSSVGALISNDDWGFKTQTMLSVTDMNKYVFPWHKRIVETIPAANKPAILHSCGMLELVMDNIIDDIKYDAKHSYEDNIISVEDSYRKYGSRIAILGGLDLDFVCRYKPEEIYDRAKKMLNLTNTLGGYALGSGNSIPYYVPQENYLAMIAAAVLNEEDSAEVQKFLRF
jgi:uroporphyrinogen decarboxylase